MSEKFRKDMDKINLDQSLKNKTIALMKNALEEKKRNKKMFFLRKAFFIPAASFLLITAMIFGIPYFSSSFTKKVNAEDLMKGIEGEKVALTTNFSKEFLNSTSDFSMAMFKQLSKKENAVYSPVSLYLALGTVLNGAEGKTKEELLKALSKYHVSAEELNLYYKSLISDLTQGRKDTVLNISNSIWHDSDFGVNKNFLKSNKTYYNTDAYKLDLQEKNAPKAINGWVKKVTKNKIDKMVDEIDRDVVMMIFSSIYFDAKWENPFPKNNTYKEPFKINDKSTIETDFMRKKENVKVINNNTEQVVALPYNDGRFTFIAMLPNGNTDIREYISKLSTDSIREKINLLKSTEATIILPKFEIEFGKSIKEELAALGINEIFDENKSNLSGMGDAKGPIYVSEVAQKTYIMVDENGTEASSVTKVEVQTKSISETICFNRPFVYAVVDTTTNLPIFMGIMDNPKASLN